MAIYQRLLDLNECHKNAKASKDIVYLNDLPNTSEAERSAIFEMLTTQYAQGDKISILPQCEQGCLRSAEHLGEFCIHCGTIVKSSIEKNVESFIWFRKPKEILSLINPQFFYMISKRFTVGGWDVIQWFTDPHYLPSVKNNITMDRIRNANIPRGWNNFIRNFDKIMNMLFSMKDFEENKKKGEIDFLKLLYERFRDRIFCDYLPAPNRSLFVFENTNIGIYRNKSTGQAISYLSVMLSIDKSLQPLSDRAKENRIAKLYQRMREYAIGHIMTELKPKPALLRRHAAACKAIFCGRLVITSTTTPAPEESIRLPWVGSMVMFRPMLINKLVNRGFSLNKAKQLFSNSIGQYNPLIHSLFKELIAEAPDGKIWLSAQRNPSLKQGSLQSFWIFEIKTDPGDKTASVHIGTVKAPNAKILAFYVATHK